MKKTKPVPEPKQQDAGETPKAALGKGASEDFEQVLTAIRRVIRATDLHSRYDERPRHNPPQ